MEKILAILETVIVLIGTEPPGMSGGDYSESATERRRCLACRGPGTGPHHRLRSRAPSVATAAAVPGLRVLSRGVGGLGGPGLFVWGCHDSDCKYGKWNKGYLKLHPSWPVVVLPSPGCKADIERVLIERLARSFLVGPEFFHR